MKFLCAALACLTLTACASYQVVPIGYSEPVATLHDSGFSESGGKAQMFVLDAVDGRAIKNSFDASAEASHGHGFALTTHFVARWVPAKPMKVKLRGSHATGAPIQAMFSQVAGTFFSVEGIVDFSPVPNGDYIVKGELKKEGSSVWIEDSKTHQIVTEKVVER